MHNLKVFPQPLIISAQLMVSVMCVSKHVVPAALSPCHVKSLEFPAAQFTAVRSSLEMNRLGRRLR